MWLFPAVLLILVSKACFAEQLTRDPTYAVVVPTSVRPSQELVVAATVLKLEYDSFTVIAYVRRLGEEICSGQYTFLKEGSFNIKMRTRDKMTPGNYTLRVAGYSDPALQGQIFTNDTELFFLDKQVSVFIQTSKPFYHQGQTVRFRVIPVQPNLMSVSTTMDVRIVDPNGYPVREWFAQHTNAGGVVSLAYPLSSNLLAYGDWSIQVDCLEYTYNQTFRVEEWYAPLFYVNVSMPTFIIRTSFGLSGLVASNHTTGRGTKGNATVVLEIRSMDDSLPKSYPTLQRDIQFFDARADFLFTREEMEVAAGGIRSLIGKELRVTAYVMDWFYNLTQVGYQSAVVYSEDIQLRFLGGGVWTFKPNLPFKIYIAAQRRDGAPLDPWNQNRTIYMDILETKDLVSPESRSVTVEIPRDTSVVEYWLYPTSTTSRISVTARYMNIQDTRRELVATRYWSPNNYYVQLSTPTKHPTVGQYMIFNVKTNTFIDKLFYYIVAAGNIIVSDTLQMYSRNKLFSVALSRDMAPSARIIAFFVAPDRQVITDSLNFYVNGTRLHQMSVKINRGKDLSYHTVEITATADPLSYVAFSAIEYQLYELGARNNLIWEEIYEEMFYYDQRANTSIRHYWQKDGQISGSFYAPTPTYGHDANTTFFYAGLYLFTDANSSFVYTACNKSRGEYPCMDGKACFQFREVCTGRAECGSDFRDEMGCANNDTFNVKLYNNDRLWRHRHIGSFYEEGAFMWKDQFTKPDGRIDIRFSVPTFPTTWVVSGFAMSRDNGLAILPFPTMFDGVRPIFISVQGPSRINQGEHMGLRVVIFNYWEEAMDVLVTIPASDDYRFVQVDRDAGGLYQGQTVLGEHQVLVPVFPGGNRMLYIPVAANRFGHIAIPISANCFVGGHTVLHHVFVDWNGVPEHYLTSYQTDLRISNSETLPDLFIPVNESFINPEKRLLSYVPYSAVSKVYIIGDIVGVSFFQSADYDLTSEKLLHMPYGTGSEATFNFAANLYSLKMLRALTKVNFDITQKVTNTLNIAMQNMLYFMQPNGAFKEFRWTNRVSTWLTANALQALSEGKDRTKDLEKLFQVPTEALNKVALWLLTAQNSTTGAFFETDSAFVRRMQSTVNIDIAGQSRPANLSLTALCVISLVKATDLTNEAKKAVDQAVSLGQTYLSNNFQLLTDPFELSIVTNALFTTNDQNKMAAMQKFKQMKRTDSGWSYWSLSPIPQIEKRSGLDTQVRLLSKQWNNATSYATAATSYALLNYMENNENDTELFALQRFLQEQHMWIGGFSSTVDTLIAMQALRTLAERNQDRLTYEITFILTSDQVPSWQKAVTINQDNWFDLQQIDLPTHWGNVKTTARGHGVALIQLETRLYHEHVFQLRQPPVAGIFSLGTFNENIRTRGFNHSYIDYKICPSWGGDTERSGMAVLEVGIPNGFIVENYTLQAYIKQQQALDNSTTLRNAESYSNKAVFYFDYLDATENNCVEFSAFRWYPVANVTEQQFIRVYEFYEPGNFNYSFYNKVELTKLTVCLVCGSYQCPYCPHYAAASGLSPSVTVTLLAAAVFLFVLRRTAS